MKLISDLQEVIKKLGVEISIDNIRKLEKVNIISCTHNPNNKYREFTDEQFRKSIRNIILYYFGVPLKDLIENKPEVIKAHISRIKKILNMLLKDLTK